MPDLIRGAVQLATPGGGSGSGGGFVLVGLTWSTLIGFSDQTISSGAGYVGVFHDVQRFMNGPIAFDGTNVTLFDASAEGMWYYGATGKIVGSPSSGSVRVVIAGLVDNGAFAGEISRQVFKAADFSDYGYVGYNLFAMFALFLGDNAGVYVVNDTDVDLTIEQGDPNDGSGPPACQVVAYLLNFQTETTTGGS